MMSEITVLEVLRTKLYLDLLRSIALEDASMQDVLLDITLGSLIAELDWHVDSDMYKDQSQEGFKADGHGFIQKRELLTYGTPARHHLNHSTRKRLLNEVQATLRSITEFFYGGVTGDLATTEETEESSLTEAVQLCKDEIESLKEEIRMISSHLMDLMIEIAKNREDLDRELRHAKTKVFPLHDAARTASIDLLAATIEASLIKLSLTKARAERALYNHRSKQKLTGEGQTVAQAIATAFAVLKRDEREMKIESQSLDRQLQEYETLLQIVDGGKSGYQQIINDWTKVKQETDECLKDLRRLGWTGD